MPRDRLTRRALVVSTAVVLLAVSTGCSRSPFVRPPVEPISEVSSPIQASSAAPPVAAANQASPPTQTAVSTPTPDPAPIVSPPLPVAPPNQVPSTPVAIEPAPQTSAVERQAAPSTQPAIETPAAAPTPLLDAALKRVEAVSHLEDEPLDLSPAPVEPAAKKGPTAVPSQRAPVITRASMTLPPIPVSIAATPDEMPKSNKPTSKKAARETRPKDMIPPEEKKIEVPADWPLPAAEVSSTIPPLEELTPFGVSELHLCRKVHGFGSFEGLNETALKAGQRLLLYCEVTGLEYQAKDHGFLSRLASRIEIKSADGGRLQWEQDLGSAADLFGRRRRDYYVNYRIELPKSLSPGSYRLKLTQTDLVANRSTSAEIPLQIVP
jgi:hypothetical protein